MILPGMGNYPSMMTGLELLTVFFLGGSAYGAIELLWRGHTHWTMIVTGGLCYVIIYLIASHGKMGRLGQYALCAAAVTGVEFVIGIVVNRILGWGVWDYTDRRFNLCGQICLRYTLYWFLLSVPGCALSRLLYRGLFHRSGGDGVFQFYG